jgi:hypothetical protein
MITLTTGSELAGAGCGVAATDSGTLAGAAGCASAFTVVPQFPQNFEVGLSSFPQFSQNGNINHCPSHMFRD